MKKLILALALLVLASPALGQTFLQQVFPDSTRMFSFEVTGDAQVALTVMWNRQVATLLAVLVCSEGGEVFDWGASSPLQDRTLRMDVGVPTGLDCVVGISTDRVAAFAINLQSFEESDLTKESARPIVLREAKDLDPDKLALLRPKLDDAMRRLRRFQERRNAPAAE